MNGDESTDDSEQRSEEQTAESGWPRSEPIC